MLRQVPWPHLLLDNFLSDSALKQSHAELACELYDYEIEARGTGRIEYSLLRSETLWRAIYSRRTLALLTVAFGLKMALNKHNMVQMRRMNDLTPDFPMHNDFTSDGDSIASFLYLSPGWAPHCGGYLHLFGSKDESSPSASIEPIENRFVAFRTNPAHWHSVARVNNWERLSALALWDISGPADY
jgi:hypothetical protein